MERHVKERLIGAAVLVAAAIILIPEMLSGTKPAPATSPPAVTLPGASATRDQASTSEATAGINGEAPLKTYTIDLGRTPDRSSDARAIDPGQVLAETASRTLNQSVPPAKMPSSPRSSSSSEPVSPDRGPDSKAPVPANRAQESSSAPAATSPAAKRPATAPAAAKPAPDTSPSSSASNTSGSSAGTAATVTAAPAKTAQGAADTAGWAIQMGSFASRATADRMVKELRANGQEAFVMPVKSGSATLYRVRVGPMKDKQAAQQLLGKLKAVAAGATLVPHP